MPVTPVYDRERLNRVLGEQFGVVSRAQALECGVSRGRLDHLVRPGGRWQRILPGVYVVNTGAVSADQRAMAALLYAGPKSLLTGAAAARRHRRECAATGCSARASIRSTPSSPRACACGARATCGSCAPAGCR